MREPSIETKRALSNLVNCFRDALDLNTMLVYSKNKSYRQVEINSILCRLNFDPDVFISEDLHSYSIQARKVCLQRIKERINVIQRYKSVFKDSPIELLDKDLLVEADKKLLLLFDFSVDLEDSL